MVNIKQANVVFNFWAELTLVKFTLQSYWTKQQKSYFPPNWNYVVKELQHLRLGLWPCCLQTDGWLLTSHWCPVVTPSSMSGVRLGSLHLRPNECLVFPLCLSCSSAGRAGAGAGSGAAAEQVRVKQEPGTEDSFSCPASSLKSERGNDTGRSACMVWTLNLFSSFKLIRGFSAGQPAESLQHWGNILFKYDEIADKICLI